MLRDIATEMDFEMDRAERSGRPLQPDHLEVLSEWWATYDSEQKSLDSQAPIAGNESGSGEVATTVVDAGEPDCWVLTAPVSDEPVEVG